jgi:hypothetical protein
MKGLEDDAGEAHVLTRWDVDALREGGVSVPDDAHLVRPGADRHGHERRVPDRAAVDQDLTPRRCPDRQAP